MKKLAAFFLATTFLFAETGAAFANSPPRLTDGGAQPGWMAVGETATYRVIYTDPDGDPPAYVQLHLPDGPREMKKASGDFRTGAVYEYSWQPPYSMEYYFEASDGKTTARFPTYEGGTLAPVDVLSEKLDQNKIYLFSKDSNQPLWSFETGGDWAQNVSISANGSYIAAKTNRYIYLFSKDSNQPLWKYQCDGEESWSGWVDISADGNYIAGGCQNSLNLFLKESSSPLWSYMVDNGNIYTTAISADGNYLVAGTSGTNKVLLFSKESGRPLWEFVGEGDIHGLAISSDGNFVAAGAHCPDRRAFAFSRESNQPLFAYQTSKDSPVWTAAISADGKSTVYGLDGSNGFNNVFVFSPDRKEPQRSWRAEGWVRSVSISGDGRLITAGSGTGRFVYLFDKDKNEPLWRYKAGERVGAVGISADGNYLVAGSKDKNVYLFSKENNKPRWNYQTDGWVNSVTISDDGHYLAAGTGASQYLAEGHTFGGDGEKGEPVCGDTVCESEKGESYQNCPQDCVPGEGVGMFSILVVICTTLTVGLMILLIKKKQIIESILFVIASALATFVLVVTWLGYERGAYELNPGARFIFETLYRYTGSWFWSIAAFTPIVLVGLYLTATLVAKDLKKSYNYPHGIRTVFICFILLILPAALHGARLIRLNLVTNFLFSLAPAALFLLFEWRRWKNHK